MRTIRPDFRLPLLAALLILAAPALARAATAPVSGVDFMSATVMQEGQSSFSGLGLRLRLKSAQLVDNVEILPTIEYWRNGSTVEPFGIRSVRKDATLAVDARWNFHGTKWNPYLGAGVGAHFLSSSVDAPSLGVNDASHSVVKGGLAALAGSSFGLTDHVDNFIELKYHHVGGYRQLKINWGLSWGF